MLNCVYCINTCTSIAYLCVLYCSNYIFIMMLRCLKLCTAHREYVCVIMRSINSVLLLLLFNFFFIIVLLTLLLNGDICVHSGCFKSATIIQESASSGSSTVLGAERC